jgi:hypothetical protein
MYKQSDATFDRDRSRDLEKKSKGHLPLNPIFKTPPCFLGNEDGILQT